MFNKVSIGPVYQVFLSMVILIAVSACTSNRYFATPDYFTRQPGILVLRNGQQLKGEISVNNLMGHTVSIRTEDNKKNVFPVKDIASCRLEIGIFEPRSIARELPRTISQPVFMERLSADSLSIALYEAYEKTQGSETGDITLQGGLEYDLAYYMQLPGDDSTIVWQFSTALPATHLSRGLDSLWQLCPELWKKIKLGASPYDIYYSPQFEINQKIVLNRLSLAAKQEKVKKILGVLEEYERCRRSE